MINTLPAAAALASSQSFGEHQRARAGIFKVELEFIASVSRIKRRRRPRGRRPRNEAITSAVRQSHRDPIAAAEGQVG